MKGIPRSCFSTFWAALILIAASCTKQDSIGAPRDTRPSLPAAPPATACDSPCSVHPDTLIVSISIDSQQWEDNGQGLFSFNIMPSVKRVFPDITSTEGFEVEFMIVSTNTGGSVIYPGADLLYDEGLLFFDRGHVIFLPFQGRSVPSSLEAKLKLRFK